jgi:hypothetical protein
MVKRASKPNIKFSIVIPAVITIGFRYFAKTSLIELTAASITSTTARGLRLFRFRNIAFIQRQAGCLFSG